jgi:probable phosphoglycerate mutase
MEGNRVEMMEIPSAPAPATRLCLVRHGETEWNTQRRIQGQIDIGLNDNGLRQADAAGRWLKTAGITALYSSDLSRAWTTAQRIGAAIGLTPKAAPELRERRYGIFEGLTFGELKEKHPASFAAYETRDPDYDFETGESLRTMFERVTGKLKALVAAHPGESIAVVLHGGVLDIANRFVRGHPLDIPRDFLIPNAGLNWLACADGRWHIESWGETTHLESGSLDELPS